MEEDPAFYKKFSILLKELIWEFRQHRIKDSEYLKKVKEIMNAVLNRTEEKIPKKLQRYDVAKAYYGILVEELKHDNNLKETFADVAIEIDKIIEQNRIVNWINNPDVENKMYMGIEDCLFELKETLLLEISLETIDKIMEECLKVAKRRKNI